MKNWQQAIDEIKRKTAIKDAFAEAGTELQRNGHGLIGVCPFHEDSDPSLHVYPEDGHYHCFGCGAHGDIFDLYQFIHNTDFGGVIKTLAQQFGVDLPENTPEQIIAEEKRRATSRLLRDIQIEAEKHLWSKRGKKAIEYLHGRGLADETIKKAHLGYWPSGNASKALLKGDRYARDQLRDVGFLASSRDDDREYDLMYKCILFPVFDRDQVVYMTGRKIDGKGHRKLKGRKAPALYGTEDLKGALAGVIVCEGEIDVLTLRQAGLTAVGLLGAGSRAGEAARLLARADQVALMLDPDEAGDKGMRRLALEVGTRALVVHPAYPEGCKDPNDMLQKVGQDKLVEFLGDVLSEAEPYLDWVQARILDDTDPINQARRISDEMMPFVAGLPKLEQDVIISRLAKTFKLSKTGLRTDLKAVAGHLQERQEKERAESGEGEAPKSWGAILLDRLSDHYQGLFYERGNEGTSLILYSPRRNETVPVSLANTRQITSAMAPELGDVTAWVLAQIPGMEARQASLVLLGALQRMVFDLKSRGGLTVVAEGLHVLGEGSERTVLLVDRGMRLIRRKGKWEQLGTPIIDEKYFIEQHRDMAGWLPSPWDIDVLNAPLKYSPEEALGLVQDALERAWEFRDGCDPQIHALLLFALPWVEMFPRKPFIHVRAPSSSGKSRLIAGWYAGRIPGMPGGMLPSSYFTTDASASGLTSLLGNSSLTTILDEFEGSETDKSRIAEILRVLRASALGGAGRLRGTRDLGARQTRLDLPCLAASIEPIGDRDADVNRWFVTELVHVHRRDPPEQILRRWIKDRGVDLEELRKSVLFGLVDRLAEVRAAYDEISNDPDLPGRDSIDARYLENVYPILAVARVLGRDWRDLACRIAEEKQQDFQEVTENRRGNRLLRAVLHAPIEWKKWEDRPIERTTMGSIIEEGISKDRVRFPEYGVILENDPLVEGAILIWVNWDTAGRSVLRDTEFKALLPTHLTKLARDCDSWVDHTNKRLEGSKANTPKKATAFRIRAEDFSNV